MSAPPPYNVTYNMAPQPSPSFSAPPPPQPVYVTAPAPQMMYAPQPPPLMQYQPQGPPPAAQPPPAIVGGVFGPMPMVTTCPSCRQQVQTNIVHSSGMCTWLICLGCFFCTASLCCWIPFVIDDTKDVTHMCSRCGTVIGKYSRL